MLLQRLAPRRSKPDLIERQQALRRQRNMPVRRMRRIEGAAEKSHAHAAILATRLRWVRRGDWRRGYGGTCGGHRSRFARLRGLDRSPLGEVPSQPLRLLAMASDKWIAYLGMGANLHREGKPPEQSLREAIAALAELGRVEAVSSLWRTTPVGPVRDQPAFVNAAVVLRTDLAPETLLEGLLALEQRFGRVRGGLDKGPRTLDLDLLLMEDASSDEPVVLHTPHLQLPHPEMHRRRFVLTPLAEIAPELRHPLLALPVHALLNRLAGAPGDEEQVLLLPEGSPKS
jgi:2-amino-4-hydroxy-6-hydroxymethyldihydropteridine diphosphokinase